MCPVYGAVSSKTCLVNRGGVCMYIYEIISDNLTINVDLVQIKL